MHSRWTLLAFCLAGPLATAASPENAGRDWGVERRSYADPVTGVTVEEITAAGSAADNLHFHFPNFTADNRHLLFVSDRTGSRQLFRAAVESGRIVQLTDDPAVQPASACPDSLEPRRVFVLRPTNWFTPLKEWITHEAWVPGTGQMTMVNDRVGVMGQLPENPSLPRTPPGTADRP